MGVVIRSCSLLSNYNVFQSSTLFCGLIKRLLCKAGPGWFPLFRPPYSELRTVKGGAGGDTRYATLYAGGYGCTRSDKELKKSFLHSAAPATHCIIQKSDLILVEFVGVRARETLLRCSCSHCDDGGALIPVDEDQYR